MCLAQRNDWMGPVCLIGTNMECRCVGKLYSVNQLLFLNLFNFYLSAQRVKLENLKLVCIPTSFQVIIRVLIGISTADVLFQLLHLKIDQLSNLYLHFCNDWVRFNGKVVGVFWLYFLLLKWSMLLAKVRICLIVKSNLRYLIRFLRTASCLIFDFTAFELFWLFYAIFVQNPDISLIRCSETKICLGSQFLWLKNEFLKHFLFWPILFSLAYYFQKIDGNEKSAVCNVSEVKT